MNGSPVTGGMLDAWTAGLDPEDAGAALVAAGVSRTELSAGSRRDLRQPSFLTWATEAAIRRRRRMASPVLAVPARRGWLRWATDPELSYRWGEWEGRQRPPLRLAIEGNVIPGEVVPRLLRSPAVASVVLPAERPAGALRRRPWQWPMRLGVGDDQLIAELAALAEDGHLVPRELIEVVDVRVDSLPVGILAVNGPLSEATRRLAEQPQLANAVLCLTQPPPESWAVVDARLSMLRALTGSTVTGIVGGPMSGAARGLLLTLRYLGHGHTFDVAVTAAFDRQIILVGELDSLNASSLSQVFRSRAKQYRRDAGAVPRPRPTRPERPGLERLLTPHLSGLEAASVGMFDQERDESSAGVRESRQIEQLLDADRTSRVVQATVARPDQLPSSRRDNVIRRGPNQVEVFVGPEQEGALRGAHVTNKQLGFSGSSVTSVRLTAVLVPILPPGDPVRSELEVPRTGNSDPAVLPWFVPGEGTKAQARIVLLHRNRVIQTAVLAGNVDGPPATLSERIVLWEDTTRLDERRPFDRAFVLNHNDGHEDLLASFAGDQYATINAIDEIKTVSGHIRDLLIQAAALKPGTNAGLRGYMAELAVEGRWLHKLLKSWLGEIGVPRRIQVVSARPSWMLPLEFLYDRPVSRTAALCDNWLKNRECGPQCFAGEEDASIVCPTIFWGLSRTIERHYIDPNSTIGDTFWLRSTPTGAESSYLPTRAALAASRKVRVSDVKAVAKRLGNGVSPLKSWDAWTEDLKSAPTNLLVLMPHSDPKKSTLEVAGTTLAKGEIEKWHVTGGQAVMPLVILFGCDTSGFKDDPAGYVPAFVQEHAAIVFSTFTMILGSHAAQMSQRLIEMLMDTTRTRVPLGEALASLRGELARRNLLAGLSLTAYGDSAWKV